MWISRASLLPTALCLAWPVAAEAPLSAIDWLSQSVATPAALPRPQPQIGPGHPTSPLSSSGPITMTPLGRQSPVTLGLVPASRDGLPRSLWGTSRSADLSRGLAAVPADTLPAIRSLLYSILLAELAAPSDGDPQETLFLARVDKLLDLGALDPALALLEQIDKPKPETFRRWFDISLLLGHENYACEVMSRSPEIAPTFPARIFCLARLGDWNAAALALRTGRTLGTIDPSMADLLERFLDTEFADGAPELPVPDRPSPLTLRMMEAIGEPVATTTLPVAFAQSELRSNIGWKARIEAGERLARTGAIPPNRLLGLYSERRAAASGGVWDRVTAIQDFEAALDARDIAAVTKTLPVVWRSMEQEELEVFFATLFGARLSGLSLDPDTSALALRIGLLSDDYEKVALAHTATSPDEAFLIGLARAQVAGTTPPDQMGAAVQAAFSPTATLDDETAAGLKDGHLGASLLEAMTMVTDGARGDLRSVTQGLLLLRKAGLESVARRAALELVLLERRG